MYYSMTQNNTIMIILILLPMFAKARLNSIMELVQQILSQFCENVSDSVPTPSRLGPAFDCSTSDNTFPSNAIDYMVSASSPSTAGSASVPDETTPTSAPYCQTHKYSRPGDNNKHYVSWSQFKQLYKKR